jgi:hypothetical protein
MSPRSVNAGMASSTAGAQPFMQKPIVVVAPPVAPAPAAAAVAAPSPYVGAAASSSSSSSSSSSAVLPSGLKPADAENYEMSDREGSSDEDEDEEDGGGAGGKAKKPIPDWARGPALEATIHIQYGGGPGAVDPDKLFPEVASCDLEEIFKSKKKRYQKRTSSGNWGVDRLTNAERLKYRQDTGMDGTGGGR